MRRCIHVLIVLVAVSMMAAGAPDVPSRVPGGTVSGADGPVPRSLTGDGSDRTYITAEIGSAEHIVSRNLGYYGNDVEWSPNGSHVAVAASSSGSGGGYFRLYSFNGTDLTTVVSITSSGGYCSVGWSPNGSHIAISDATGGNNMRVYSFNGTTLTEVAAVRLYIAQPLAWSPDGRFLAATGSNNAGLHVYSFNGTALTHVDTLSLTGWGNEISWDPDGTRLALAWTYIQGSTYVGKLQIVRFDGSSLWTELEISRLRWGSSIDWSPDGAYIAFCYETFSYTSQIDVYRVTEDDLGRPELDLLDTVGGSYSPGSVTWNPTGDYLAASGYRSGTNLYIYSFDGSTLETVLTWSFQYDTRSISWRSDGKYIGVCGFSGSEHLKVYKLGYEPLFTDDHNEQSEDTSWTLDVLANDRTVTGDLIITNVIQPDHGHVNVTPDGRDLLYTPPADWFGRVTFTYRHSDMWDDLPSATVNITVLPVNDEPVITTTDVWHATEDEPYSVRYDAVDADPDAVLGWAFGSEAGWLSFNNTSLVLSGLPTNDDVGAHWVNISATDNNGTSDRHGFLVRVENTNDPPSITSVDVTEAAEDRMYTAYYAAEDPDPTQDTLTWSLDAGPAWLEMVGNHLFGTPTNDDVGEHATTVTVSDGNGGSDSTEFTITVSNTNDQPWIVTEPPIAATEDEEYRATFEAEDVDGGDVMAWSMTGPAWLVIDGGTGVVTGTPTNDDVGTHLVTVTVTDGALGDVMRFAIVVANSNDAPVWVTVPEDQELMEGGPMFLDVMATDEDGDPLTYGVSSKPRSDIVVTPSSGAIRWLAAEVGDYTVTVSATDGAESITQELGVTVEAEPVPPPPPPNHAPVIQPVGDVNVTAGEPLFLQLEGSDENEWDAVNLTFSLVNGPEDMVVSEGGVVYWWPDDKTVGVRYVTVELTDGKSKATMDFEVEVLEAVEDDGDSSGVEDGGGYLWLVVALVVVVLILVLILLWMHMGSQGTAAPEATGEEDEGGGRGRGYIGRSLRHGP